MNRQPCFLILALLFPALVLGLLLATPGAGEPLIGLDINGDGVVDELLPAGEAAARADLDADGLLGTAPPSGGGATAQALSDLDFAPVWDSGTTLSNVLGLGAGDADRDGRFDFAGAHFTPNQIHLFAADGQGSYEEIWNSGAPAPPSSYIDFAFGDTDGDGLGEIFAAEVSTFGKVMLFEESAGGFTFVHDTIRESDPIGTRRPRKILIGDTNLNGREEVIVICGGSAPTDGLVAIWEHSGVIGENLYTRVFAYTTPSYLFSAALGDTDQDGIPEIVLGYGGSAGFPLNIRRLEYDPAAQTWVHTLFQSAVIGLPTAPHVADLDDDGRPELAFGSSSFVAIFENTGENAYALRLETATAWSGNVLALDARPLTVPGTMSLAAGSFGGDLRVLSYDPDLASWEESYARPALGGPIRGLALADDGADGFEEILTALGTVDQIRVYRRVSGPSAIPAGDPAPSVVALTVAPNPFAASAHITIPGGLVANELSIYDALGRRVRTLRGGPGGATWDARDDHGRRVPRGVYWIRAATDPPDGRGATRVVYAP